MSKSFEWFRVIAVFIIVVMFIMGLVMLHRYPGVMMGNQVMRLQYGKCANYPKRYSQPFEHEVQR